MKRALISALFAVVVMCGCAVDGGKLHVKTDLVEWGDSLVVLKGEQQQVFTGVQGQFEFDLDVSGVCEVVFVEPKVLRGEVREMRYYPLPAVPGEEVLLKAADTDHYDVTGTGFYADYHKVMEMNREASKELREQMSRMRAMDEAGVPQDSLVRYYERVSPPLIDRYEETLLQYVRDHRAEEAAVAVIPIFGSVQKARQALEALAPEVREGRMKPLWSEAIEGMEMRERQERAQQESALKQAAGVEAPDFTLNDINGRPLSLSSLRGKYVVIDFWGSWCGWCIKGFPQMKEYYRKYKGKFEILGVACNDKENKWKQAVQEHGLPWLQVFNTGRKVLDDYAIQGFPTKVIVGPDGKIVQTIVGEDPQFYAILDRLFGK